MSAAAEPPHIVILAWGEGRRMGGTLPKALYPVFFRPMVHYALDAAMALAHRSLSLVAGAGENEIREQCRGMEGLRIFGRAPPSTAAEALAALELALAGQGGDVLILSADAVLLSASSLRELLAQHQETSAACTVGRAAAGGADAAAYCFRSRHLIEALKSPFPPGPARELAASRRFIAAAAQGAPAADYMIRDPLEALRIDDLHGHWRVETLLRERFNRELMLEGVALQDPRTTLIDPRCRIGRDVRIEAGCTVINSSLDSGVHVENFCRIVDSSAGAGCLIRQGTCAEGARLGRGCRVGPYARLRPGTHLADDVRIGNFVELKNSSLGSGTRAARLAFIADAQVGRNVSVGCGFITCNSSGRPLKQRTIIEDDVFIGSASQAIAPVTLGAGSFIATGSSVTDDVPAGSFVISRGRQVTKPGCAGKYGKPKRSTAPR